MATLKPVPIEMNHAMIYTTGGPRSLEFYRRRLSFGLLEGDDPGGHDGSLPWAGAKRLRKAKAPR